MSRLFNPVSDRVANIPVHLEKQPSEADMIRRTRGKVVTGTCLVLAFSAYSNAQMHVATPTTSKTKTTMTTNARGPFDVKIGPLDAYLKDEGLKLARMSIDKQFRGDLEATSKGEMF